MNKPLNNKVSKFLSYILRHQPEAIDLKLEPDGWVAIDLLIHQANKHGETLNHEIVKAVVISSDKQRFTISDDGKKIRAAQGHSTQQVNIQYIEQMPPEFLYHGTATRFIDSIKAKGLIPGDRHYVHLSSDKQTATMVGQRHGKPVVIKIQSGLMFQLGFKFYLADNNVWLTHRVPTQFLIF